MSSSPSKITTAVILAAGRGSRLKHHTEHQPKGFLEIGNETLIERSIRLLKAAGISRIIIGTGYKSNAFDLLISKFELERYHNEEFAQSESYYTLYLAKDLIQEDFLILESDILYDPKGLNFLLTERFENTFLASGFTSSGDEVYLRINEKTELVHISQNQEDRDGAFAELVGITKLSKSYFDEIVMESEKDPEFKKIKYEFAFMKYQRSSKIHVSKLEDLVWCEIDDESHLERAKNVIFPKLT